MPSNKSTQQPERLQKILARSGLGSRREIEAWIRDGRIAVNGRTASLGDRITQHDKVKLDNRIIQLRQQLPTKTRVLAYYKPEGEIVTRKDPQGRRTVYDSIPAARRGKWTAIGRLDINTTGLLLLTNDGGLANGLMHPGSAIEREYAVRVLGQASKDQLNRLLTGVELEDGPARFTDIVDSGGRGANHWYHVVIMEGRNREVRRLWESQGLVVNRLIRVRFGPCILPKRRHTGQFWDLSEKEIKDLRKSVESEKCKV